MGKKLFRLVLTFLLILVIFAPSRAFGVTETYGDYSMMFSRSAGQYWTGNQVGGQWAWSPQSFTESHIYWGNPVTWPPAYHERFIVVGDWVTLDGWWDNGTYYKVNTTTEWQGDFNCSTSITPLPTGGAQHYTHWTIPANGYCLFAVGTITEQSTGNVVHFQHKQTWTKSASCLNAFNPSRPCLIQSEQWSDDHGTPLTQKLARSSTIAKGIGMAWHINQTYPSNWYTDLKYNWMW